MKLAKIHFRETPKLPGVRPGAMTEFNCFNPPQSMIGWRAQIRGATVYFISPPGFRSGLNPGDRDPKGPCEIHEVPRVQCYLQWEGQPEDMTTVAKFDTPPFGPETPKAEAPAPTEEKKTGGLLDQVL